MNREQHRTHLKKLAKEKKGPGQRHIANGTENRRRWNRRKRAEAAGEIRPGASIKARVGRWAKVKAWFSRPKAVTA